MTPIKYSFSFFDFFSCLSQVPETFKELNECYLPPSTNLPPDGPINFIETAIFFADHWQHIKTFIHRLPGDTQDIFVLKAKDAVANVNVENPFSTIRKNFKVFQTAFGIMTTPGQFFYESYRAFNDVIGQLDTLEDQKYSDIFRNFLMGNQNVSLVLEIVLAFSDAFSRNEDPQSSRYNPEELKALNYSPLVASRHVNYDAKRTSSYF